MTLCAQRLIDEACRATGFEDFGPPTFREGLDALIESAESEANLSDGGRAQLAAMIGVRLTNRLRLYDWHRRFPEISELSVPEPVFVIGLWRTGTTIMSYLLAQDPARRSLLRWEAADPCPPPGFDAGADQDRIDRLTKLIEEQHRRNPQLAAINIQEATGPTECVLTLSHEFKSQLFDCSLFIPSYYRWNRSVDQSSAYAHHKATLQVLQWKSPKDHWHLKSPAHTLSLDALRAVYPDARFIVVHRDPAVSLASACDFWELQMRGFTDHVDTAAVGRHWLGIYTDALDDLSRFLRTAAPESFVELQYHELRDPLAAIARAFEHLGLPFGADTERAMADTLKKHQAGKHGKHTYSLERYGLNATEVDEVFRPHIERMGIMA